MRTQPLWRSRVAAALAVALVALVPLPSKATPGVAVQCGGNSCAPLTSSQDIAPYHGVTASPRATCGRGDVVESKQGEPATGTYGFLCNLREVSNLGPGSTLALAVYGHCAYYQLGFGKGTAVVDLSDAAHPHVTATLTTPAMQYAHEGLRVNVPRGLLGAMAAGVVGEGFQDPYFDAYDVSRDCAHPRLLGSTLFPGLSGHEGSFSADGDTFYASQVYGPGEVSALDVRDPGHPTLLWTVTGYAAHGLTTSPDGRRLYVSTIATPGVSAVPNALGGCNGVVILDVSRIQAREPNPLAKVIDYFCWQDGIAAQVPFYFTSHSKPYLVVTDEGGSVASNGVTAAARATGGHARIIDLSDERHPKVVSQLITENQVANGGGSFHYCTPDRQEDPTVMGCTSWQGNGGFRVYDVRDVRHPREIAYYSIPGNNSGSPAYFYPATGRALYADERDGLTMVQFSKGVWPFTAPQGDRSTTALADLPMRALPQGLIVRNTAWTARQRQIFWLCGVGNRVPHPAH